MKFNIKALSFSCGIFCSGLFVLCAFFVWIAPILILRFFNLFLHGISLETIYNPNVGVANFVAGLILTFVFSVLGAAIFGWLYNKLNQE